MLVQLTASVQYHTHTCSQTNPGVQQLLDGGTYGGYRVTTPDDTGVDNSSTTATRVRLHRLQSLLVDRCSYILQREVQREVPRSSAYRFSQAVYPMLTVPSTTQNRSSTCRNPGATKKRTNAGCTNNPAPEIGCTLHPFCFHYHSCVFFSTPPPEQQQ